MNTRCLLKFCCDFFCVCSDEEMRGEKGYFKGAKESWRVLGVSLGILMGDTW